MTFDDLLFAGHDTSNVPDDSEFGPEKLHRVTTFGYVLRVYTSTRWHCCRRKLRRKGHEIHLGRENSQSYFVYSS